MNDVVTMRLPEAVIKELEGIARAEYLDMVTLIRSMCLAEVKKPRDYTRLHEINTEILWKSV